MTRKKWIEKNLSFYHITPTRNLESIFNSGLENRNGLGVCVIRSNHEMIIKFICEMMLIADGDDEFSIIQIKPKTINLQPEEILDDQVEEITNDLHNYIDRQKILVKEDDVIGKFKTDPLGILNLKKYEQELKDLGIIEKLY